MTSRMMMIIIRPSRFRTNLFSCRSSYCFFIYFTAISQRSGEHPP